MNNVDTEGTIDLTTKRRVPVDAVRDLGRFLLVDGDVMFNNTNSPDLVGKSAVFRGFDEPVVFSNHFTRIRVRRDRLEPRFLARWLALEWRRGRFARMCNQWVNQASVRKDALLEMEVPTPALDEQRRIADILDKADAIRRKRKEAIALTDELLRSAFLEMFGDPVTNPKGWPVRSLGSLLGFLTSGSRGWAQYYANAGETFLRIQNVRKDRLDLSDVAYVQAPNSAEARRTATRPGDVLLSITADLGRTAVVPENLERAFINQHLAILRPLDVHAEYLSAFLASEGGQRQINRRNKGGVKAGLNFDDIRSIEVPLPSDTAQRAFASVKKQIRRIEAESERALSANDELFNSLVARAFSGIPGATETVC
jgi:type I restriction enzyme S subunit